MLQYYSKEQSARQQSISTSKVPFPAVHLKLETQYTRFLSLIIDHIILLFKFHRTARCLSLIHI